MGILMEVYIQHPFMRSFSFCWTHTQVTQMHIRYKCYAKGNKIIIWLQSYKAGFIFIGALYNYSVMLVNSLFLKKYFKENS